jgi:predicted MFS family arabinose efflux permease
MMILMMCFFFWVNGGELILFAFFFCVFSPSPVLLTRQFETALSAEQAEDMYEACMASLFFHFCHLYLSINLVNVSDSS